MSGSPTRRVVAFGDPQASHDTLLTLLRSRGLLAGDRVRDDVRLVCMGDCFDWDKPTPEARAASTADGLKTLRWLASHPADQVVILLGNHDLARVGELATLDEAQFHEARREADRAYYDEQPERDEAAFRAAWDLPSWEVTARDLSTFSVEQRDLVRRLLDEERVSIAFAPREDLLLTHAGITVDELAVLGLPADTADATIVAAALQAALRKAWAGSPTRLVLPDLHVPGDGRGEGVGMFFHRPGRGPRAKIPRRRFAPDRLPTGFTQGIGHVRDKKSRALFDLPPSGRPEGAIRTLTIGERHLRYDLGVLPCPPGHARLLFLDGGLGHARTEDYELFDVDAMGVWAGLRSTIRARIRRPAPHLRDRAWSGCQRTFLSS